jgi:4a-hydroxytetrahydrobiopterin dehydratase
MPKLLSAAEVKRELRWLKGWRQKGRFLEKTFEFKAFMDGMRFIDAIAIIAEREEHHPDIHVRYTTVKLQLQTHSEGGVTEWDVELARAIEEHFKKKKPSGG